MSLTLHHVGHIVSNLEEGIAFYQDKFGAGAPVQMIDVPLWGARMAMLPFAGSVIEIIEPGGLNGDPAGRCRDQRGEGPFQFAFFCDDYDAEIAALRNKGFTPEEVTVPGEPPLRLAFLPPEQTHGMWMEFIDGRVAV